MSGDKKTFVGALEDTLSSLKHRPHVHDRVVTEMCEHQEQCNRVLPYSHMFRGEGNSQNPNLQVFSTAGHTISAASSYVWGVGTPNTREERLQDVAALESVLPNIQNFHAKRFVLALKMEIEAEIRRDNSAPT